MQGKWGVGNVLFVIIVVKKLSIYKLYLRTQAFGHGHKSVWIYYLLLIKLYDHVSVYFIHSTA